MQRNLAQIFAPENCGLAERQTSIHVRAKQVDGGQRFEGVLA